jgi:hypothetical protein
MLSRALPLSVSTLLTPEVTGLPLSSTSTQPPPIRDPVWGPTQTLCVFLEDTVFAVNSKLSWVGLPTCVLALRIDALTNPLTTRLTR